MTDTAMKRGSARWIPSAFFVAVTWFPALLLLWVIFSTPDTTPYEWRFVVAMLIGVHVVGGVLGVIGKPESSKAPLWVFLAPLASFVVWILVIGGYEVVVEDSSFGEVLRGLVLTSFGAVLLCAPAAGMARLVQRVRVRG